MKFEAADFSKIIQVLEINSAMNIQFTSDIFTFQSYGGASRYMVRLAEALVQLNQSVEISAKWHYNSQLNSSAFHHGNNIVLRRHRLDDYFYHGLNSIHLQLRLAVHRPDIVHFSYYRDFPPVFTRAKKVLSVLDMISEVMNASHLRSSKVTQMKRRAVQDADLILCISESTRQDLIKIFDVPIEKTRVTYLAADEPPDVPIDDCHPLNGHPYILYVGHRSGYKNFNFVIDALSQISSNLIRPIKLVAFGSIPFQDPEIEFIKDAGFDLDRILHISGDDAALYQYYRHAVAFVYPSLYEGFGIPPLEAMSVGCPVLCSNVSSIPEIVGSAAFLFDPKDANSLAQQFEALFNNEGARAQKITQGVAQFKKFSWLKCAEETLRAYRSVCGAI